MEWTFYSYVHRSWRPKPLYTLTERIILPMLGPKPYTALIRRIGALSQRGAERWSYAGVVPPLLNKHQRRLLIGPKMITGGPWLVQARVWYRGSKLLLHCEFNSTDPLANVAVVASYWWILILRRPLTWSRYLVWDDRAEAVLVVTGGWCRLTCHHQVLLLLLQEHTRTEHRPAGPKLLVIEKLPSFVDQGHNQLWT